MEESINEATNAHAGQRDPRFPHAPGGWTPQAAETVAEEEGLELNEDRWELVRALQEYYHRHEGSAKISLRELHDALDERFHSRGGRKYLYTLLPGGPVAQGARLAGLEAPREAIDTSFGSVS